MNPNLTLQKIDAEKLKEILANKSTTNCILIFLIIVVYVFVLFIPKVKVLFTKFSEANRVKASIIKTEKDWANLSVAKEKISQLNAEIEYYEKKLPGEKEIPAILKYLSDSARKLNVRISEIKPVYQKEDQAQTNLIYYSVPISLKAECGYHELGKFLSELESADRFMKISNIKIMAHPRSATDRYVRLTVATYVMQK